MKEVKKWFANYEGIAITHDITIPEQSIPDLLTLSTIKFGENYALSMYGNKLTYYQLSQQVMLFATALQQKGIEKGDTIGIMLPNCPQYVVAYYGILFAGGIVTQINPMLVERELNHVLNDSRCSLVVTVDQLYPKLVQAKKNSRLEEIVVVSSKENAIYHAPDCTFQSFLQIATFPLSPVPIHPKKDVAVLQYTGGTTGLSKGAMLTHYNLVSNLVQMNAFFKSELIEGKEKILSVVPFFHVLGMTACVNWGICGGHEIIILPRFDVAETLATIQKEKPTIFPGVPTMYVALNKEIKTKKHAINHIRFCFSGSAPMPVEVMKEFEQKTGAKIYEGYGLSETSPVANCNPPGAARKAGSVGLGLPQTAYKIVDIASGEHECAVGELGEIIIKGPQVMVGYWNCPEETAITLRDGWLYTGDIGYIDENGYLYIVDRKKDLIIAGGFNIYPRDVEEVLYEHPAILEAVVIGVPDVYRGETVKALIVLKEGVTITTQEIAEYCRDNLSAYKVPRIIEFRGELPKTNVGKILRRVLREEVQNK